MKVICIFILVVSIFAIPSVRGSNILFYHGVATSSHRTAIWPLAEKLADLGHNVTYIFPVTKRVGSHPKIEELTPSKSVPIVREFVSDFDINIRLTNTEIEWLQTVFSKALNLCEAFYESPEIIEWLSRPDLKVDLVFIDASMGECAYGLVHKFKAKHILFSPVILNFLSDGFGVVPESSSVPDIFYHVKPTEMTFYNRMMSLFTTLTWRYNYVEFTKIVEPVIQEKLNLTSFPSISEFERNTSLMFLNSHFVEEYALSLPPFFVPYSGLWCSKGMKTKPLPEKLASFINDTDSFVYVSLGSAVVASAMPISLRNEFFNTFKSLPKIKFFWRWTGDIPANTPVNVMLLNWFPQNDILAHPKIKGFITQAGRPSTQEALCYGVPLITIPIMGDQEYNADRLEYIGAGIKIDVENLTVKTLGGAINELLHNPERKSKMMEMSKMFKDRPMDPLDNAVYWTEYALRYDTTMMKPIGIHQTWYQRRFLDVYGVLLLALLTVTGIVLFSVALVIRCSMRILLNPKIKHD